ncbi:hypothetical protein AHAS_Ahas18G0130500 [Arachis hypogaea]
MNGFNGGREEKERNIGIGLQFHHGPPLFLPFLAMRAPPLPHESATFVMEPELLGYDNALYRLDQVDHIAGRHDRMLIEDMLFLDTSDSRVHIRWLLLLEDLDRCGRLSWAQQCWPDFTARCRATYYRWAGLRPDNDRGENRLCTYRRLLNGLGVLNPIVPPRITEVEASTAVVCPLLFFAIVQWHQVRPQDRRGRGRDRGRGRRGGGRGRWDVVDVGCNRDFVSPPPVGDGVQMPENGRQVVGVLLGPVPGNFFSLGPPGTSLLSKAGCSHQEQADAATTIGHIDLEFDLQFSQSDFGAIGHIDLVTI